MTGPVFEFLKAYDELTGRRPWSVVEEWESFVTGCEEGYHWNEYEYRNDGHCRAILERTLDAPQMKPFPDQIRAMKDRVSDADERLRALFVPGVEIGGSNWEWWERGVLRNGIGDYTADMKQNYGIDLANPSGPMMQ